MKYLLVFFSMFFYVAKANFNKDQKIEEKKQMKFCRKFYPKVRLDSLNLKEGEVVDTAYYYDCMLEYFEKKKDKNPSEYTDSKIEHYNEKLKEILESLKSADIPDEYSERVVVEKQIIIKPSKAKLQVLEQEKPKTLTDARNICLTRGFKYNSNDQLEKFLFERCIKEIGFATEKGLNFSKMKIKKSKPKLKMEESQKVLGNQFLITEKIDKKIKEQEVKPDKVESIIDIPEITSFKKDSVEVNKDNKEVIKKPLDDSKSDKTQSSNIQSIIEDQPDKEREEIEHHLPNDEEKSDNIPSLKLPISPILPDREKKTYCRIDENGNKICRFIKTKSN